MVKRAQAAMEFLMTYGWAILVVLAAIAALAYFGVLSPDRFMPEKCTFPSGSACLDFTATATQIDLRVQNAGGFDMSDVNITLILSDGTNHPCNTSGDNSLTNGATDTYGCPGSYVSGKIKADVNITYTNQQTSMRHTKMGELIAKIE